MRLSGSTRAAALLVYLAHGGEALVSVSSTSPSTSTLKASPSHPSANTMRSNGSSSRTRSRAGGSLKMTVRTPPPKQAKRAAGGEREADDDPGVIERVGRKAAAAGVVPVLGAKTNEEHDIMWKLKVRDRPFKINNE
ncbi:unnamed protein product [Ectocarpus sp. 12 AP-2014]